MGRAVKKSSRAFWSGVFSLLFLGIAASAARPEQFLPGEGPAIRAAAVNVSLAVLWELGMQMGSRGTAGAPHRPSPATVKQARALLSGTPSRYGLFVSIFRVKDSSLVGCMGTVVAGHTSLLEEVEHWSMMALSQDPRTKRGPPLGPVTVIISFVASVEPVANPLFVDSLRHGLLLRYRGREALVLPGEARTAAYAHGMVLEKLGLARTARPDGLEAFRVNAVRFGPGRALFGPGTGSGG